MSATAIATDTATITLDEAIPMAEAIKKFSAEDFPIITTEACDACGVTQIDQVAASKRARIAQAFVRWVMPSGQSLTWCKHHAEKFASSPEIALLNIQVIDETDKINKAPSVSANSI